MFSEKEDTKAAPLLSSQRSSAQERWFKVSTSFRFIRAMDQRAFMNGIARFNVHEISDSFPIAQKLAEYSAEMAKLASPADDDSLEIVDEDASLQTNSEAIVNLLNNCLGSGMLTMGFAIANAGIVPAICMMMLSAFLNRFTLLLNLHTCTLAGCDPASAEIGEKVRRLWALEAPPVSQPVPAPPRPQF